MFAKVKPYLITLAVLLVGLYAVKTFAPESVKSLVRI